MEPEKLSIGTYYRNILCESFLDPDTNRIRVRPLVNQVVPPSIFIECSKSIREGYPLGTKFKALGVTVCKKQTGRLYLRADNQKIYKVED